MPWGDKLILHGRGLEPAPKILDRHPEFPESAGDCLALSKVSDFAEMIEGNGMRICYVSDLGAPFTDRYYYIGASRAEDAPSLRGIGLPARVDRI
jgi:hypothetical protein